ncbi:hypothetical protein ACFE04_023090 [Oxalis oulophora]
MGPQSRHTLANLKTSTLSLQKSASSTFGQSKTSVGHQPRLSLHQRSHNNPCGCLLLPRRQLGVSTNAFGSLGPKPKPKWLRLHLIACRLSSAQSFPSGDGYNAFDHTAHHKKRSWVLNIFDPDRAHKTISRVLGIIDLNLTHKISSRVFGISDIVLAHERTFRVLDIFDPDLAHKTSFQALGIFDLDLTQNTRSQAIKISDPKLAHKLSSQGSDVDMFHPTRLCDTGLLRAYWVGGTNPMSL